MTVLEIPTPDPRTFDDASRPFAEAVASRYAIKRMIGRGGMGIVYLARDRRLDRLVAIKTLPPQLANDESIRQRFLRETRTAGAMSHPNIVPIHGADEIDGHVFFVMGFVDGDSLATVIRAEGRLDARPVVRILRDVAGALGHAHDRGTIHRDIKAENILIERASGRALVTDFGIARLAEAAPLTATGQMLGTVYYVSPEQVAGENVDPRSDLYSLGVVGFLALTGRFPFEGDLASAVLVAHVTKAPPPVRSINPDVPASLASIVDRCLAKDPRQRFENAEAVAAALESVSFEAGRPASAERSTLISETEAHAVWERAASLQAATGVQPRPSRAPAPRDAERDRARISGFRVGDVVQAGREAGIGTGYLDRVLVEHGLVGGPTISAAPIKSSFWAGAPLDIVHGLEVEGELGARHFDRILNVLRDNMGALGAVTARTREVGWNAEQAGRRLEVSIVPADGKTSIRLAQSIRRIVAGVLVSTMAAGGIVGALAGAISDRLMHSPTPRWARELGINLFVSRHQIHPIALTVAVVVALAAIPVGRALVRRLFRSDSTRLRLLAEAVSANVQLAVRE